MANISIIPEILVANYEQTINYAIDVSFNSLTQGPGSDIKVICFIPAVFAYYYHSPSYPIESIEEQPLGDGTGTNLIFHLLTLPQAGVSMYFDLYVKFKLTTPNTTQGVLNVTVMQPGAADQSVDAVPVTLQANPNYVITQTLLLPNAAGGVSGDIFVYQLILQNVGDQGATATQIHISEVLPPELTLDENYVIVGKDISDNQFADPSGDGILATIVNANSFTFTLPSYHGTRYQILFKGNIAPGLAIGNQYIASGSYSYSAQTQVGPRTFGAIFQVQQPQPQGDIVLYTPVYSRAGALFNATASIVNSGNVTLANPLFHINNTTATAIPALTFQSMETGTMQRAFTNELLDIPYEISFVTLQGTPLPTISANTNQSQHISGSQVPLPPGDSLLTVVYTFLAPIPIGASFTNPMSFTATIRSDIPDGGMTYVDSTFEWYTTYHGAGQKDVNNAILIDHISMLYMEGREVAPNNSVKPGDHITYEAVIDCKYSPLVEPVFVMILDKRLVYNNDVTYLYEDFFGQPTDTIPRPLAIVIPNYGGGSNTVLLISYSGVNQYVFNQLARITITLSFTVADNGMGVIRQQMLLGTNVGEFAVADECDTYNAIQADGSVRTLLATPTFVNQIEVAMGLQSDFMIKGILDTDYVQYPTVGKTLAGEPIYYRINLSNQGETSLRTVEIVNILPHINDTGVILTDIQRHSQFSIYPIQFGQATLEPTVVGDPEPLFTVYYSQSYNPVRFGADMNTIIGDVNDWSSQPPQDTTSIKAYKLALVQGVFRPGQTLKLDILAMAPVGTAVGLLAWDSFAAQITYADEDGSIEQLLPVEPEMAGVQIMAPIPGSVTIGGFVWEDKNKSGIYQIGDPGVNDTIVVLYDDQGNIVQSVLTSPNAEGVDGYYAFTNIDHGTYFVRFVPNTRIYNLTKQVLSDPNGSMASPDTGLTPPIDMTVETENMHITAGLVPIRTMDNILLMNKAANKMLRSTIYNQMLLEMKLEDVKRLIE